MRLTAVFHPPDPLAVEIQTPRLGVSTGTPIAREYVERAPYTGPYAITPGPEAQALPTKNLRMTDDVVVQAIPSNYGKITWDGSTLTVS